MVGIVSYGAYIPLYRLGLDKIAAAWNRGSGRGELAIANHDEDSITMAVEASMDCLAGIDRKDVAGLYFASTTMPYKEKQSASIIAAALDLPSTTYTTDFSGSLRAASNALKAARDAIRAGSTKSVLVVTADCRLAAPGTEFESTLGSGAAAVLLNDSAGVARFEASYSRTSPLMDIWRTEEDRFVRSWESKFVTEEGYSRHVQEAITQVVQRSGIPAADFQKIALYAPDARSLSGVVRNLGLDPARLQDSILSQIGNTGCASALMLVVAALEEANTGDKILLVSYGDGWEADILTVTGPAPAGARLGIRRHIASKRPLASYHKYLVNKELLVRGIEREQPHPPLYGPQLWRERADILELHGSRCNACGTIQYPVQRICVNCQCQDKYEEITFSEKRGTIFTFTKDNLAPCIDPPLVRTVVDFDGGGRGLFTMTDCPPDEVKIGMPVVMTLRSVLERGIRSYSWKCKPVRG